MTMLGFRQIMFIARMRLRARSVAGQELLAVLGIAVGVALLFASQVASQSLDGSVRQTSSTLAAARASPKASCGKSGPCVASARHCRLWSSRRP
jgi:hypothetical protein